ncbi:redox-regulated ATPase YchF [candidate division WOR-1 bacterium RIFOXYB2_FULL_42_35]|uniref:Ribosome-binding ATPase YchF n=1 Tax=candidate division WOR-1 bacterium RIFOXYC2_FULL_41_25 TaxID=1802586 RepID=A0A1F4TKS0_UNCSA|nr:MAG: redox-regulated ATPase YchF [candidate division WOR-1 bacterium RIFOXYA2_FULL_41_14]OGC22454.1 MAG: redox-regulated ATPase YchF [candidate division WOR-1 bacterium RIFOXYB2_FULL_42_35]OGC33130.1 MAG: redox-regulated ATPase YchF [candidate division WOR-1 bacterium RIFOXYC2_FULL_41_25]OGC43061.1 MAG: redox-regulated ATPase YchF [candidate division WOR-1 bacterium RIFOXYD2_FULL_41_8]
MSFSLGIIGLPNVGKSTLFNALSSAKAEASNYPFCTINPNIGVVEVPDPRLSEIKKIMGSPKAIPTIIDFHDIAGLVKGAHKGEGLGNKFLANIRDVDALVHVVRCFSDDNVTHVSGQVDPKADIEIIQTELVLADLAVVEKRLEKTKIVAKAREKKTLEELRLLKTYRNLLGEGKGIGTGEEKAKVPDLNLLTSKPILYVANVDESGNTDQVAIIEQIAQKEGSKVVAICSKLEAELKDLEPEEAKEFLESAGQKETGLNRFISASYKLLGLISFFTANNKEARAWTLKSGSTVFEAAGKVHSDIQKGFIAAEVAHFKDLEAAGSYQKLKETGQLHLVGREYVVEDGDVVLIRFNV